MDALLSFLQSLNVDTILTDPKVMVGAGIIVILSIVFRWKAILLLFFGVGAMTAVIRYSRIQESSGPGFDRSLLVFIGGCIVVAVVLIYFMFIRGD